MAAASEFSGIEIGTDIVVQFDSFTLRGSYGGIDGDDLTLIDCTNGNSATRYGDQKRKLWSIVSWETQHAVLCRETWMCAECGWRYDANRGVPEQGIAPGTPWAGSLRNWQCPECGSGMVLSLDG